MKLRNNLRLNGQRGFIASAAFAIALALVTAGSLPRGAAADDLPTTTSISGPTFAAAGASVTFVATVRGNATDGAPGGTMTFKVDGVGLDPVPVTQNADNVTSSATFTTSALPAGTHTITATYLPGDWTTGNPAPYATSTSPPASITVGSNAPKPTTMTLTSDPSPVQPGRPATFVATVSEIGSSVPPVGLVTFDDNGLTMGVVALVNGVAVLPNMSGFQGGLNLITATYAGNQLDASVSNSLSFTVPEGLSQLTTRTVLTVTPGGAIHPGDSVQAYATITQVGTGRPSPSGLVTFLVNGRSFPGNQVLLGPGGRTPSVTIAGFDIGANKITAEYVGDENDLGSSGSATVAVVGIGQPLTVATSVTYTGATTAAYGANVVLKAQLVTESGAPAAQEHVTLTFGGAVCDVVTDDGGVATCVLPALLGPGLHDVTVEFAGDDLLLPSSTTGSVTVTQQTTAAAYTGATTGAYGDTVLLGGTLLDGANQPLAGATLTFTYGPLTCNATTNALGAASCSVTLTTVPGVATSVSVTFAGDANYVTSSATKAFTETRATTTVANVVSTPILVSGPVTLQARLVHGTTPVAGRTVTLSVGGQSCSGTTTTTGDVHCTLPASPALGPGTVTATFTGDLYYSGSTDTDAALLYANAPGAGSFVIGDGNAATGTSVTFWGAQWAKLNKVSGGSAPDAFKGYAASGGRACGVSWTTGPGNSSSPPAGPLPAYMAVLVTSSVSKSGSAIAGTTAHVVVVKTDGGYKNDPGHAGTGTVVATVC